jgi:hypothetical protein
MLTSTQVHMRLAVESEDNTELIGSRIYRGDEERKMIDLSILLT